MGISVDLRVKKADKVSPKNLGEAARALVFKNASYWKSPLLYASKRKPTTAPVSPAKGACPKMAVTAESNADLFVV